MSLLLETIQIKNGLVCNIQYHNRRFNTVRKELFNTVQKLSLENFIQIPDKMLTGIVKCKVIYNENIKAIEFKPYKIKSIKSLRLVEARISYSHKYADRTELNKLKQEFPSYDEILITKNGFITDTTFSNIIFLKQGKWYTPVKPLLKGTKREQLLENGIIIKKQIHKSQLNEYSHFMLINAMLDFAKERALSIQIIKGI